MKKKFTFVIFLIVCAMLFSGCSETVGNDTALADTADMTASPPENDPKTESESTLLLAFCQDLNDSYSMPSLNVIFGSFATEASRGTASWEYSTGDDGLSHGVEMDSSHPLDAKDTMMPLMLDDDDPDIKKHVTDWLTLYDIPNEITVERWGKECWGQTAAESENVEVVQYKTDADEDLFLIPFEVGEYIYSVTAKWNDRGVIHYSFYTVEPYTDTTTELITQTEDGDCMITLPISKTEVKANDAKGRDLTDGAIKNAEIRIANKIARYEESPVYWGDVNDRGELCLWMELISHYPSKGSDENTAGCGIDHDHVIFSEILVKKKI